MGQTIKPAVLSVVSEYAALYVPKTVMLDLPLPLTTLYDKQARESSLEELQGRAETLFETVTREKIHITFLFLVIFMKCNYLTILVIIFSE